jgi:putative ABC transport system substrate-binding protein
VQANIGVQDDRRHPGSRHGAITRWLCTVGCIVTLAFGILVAPLVATAQPAAKIRRIGVLAFGSPPASPDWQQGSPFWQGLRELGWIEGQTIGFEWRWADRRFDRLPGLAGELVSLNVDVIFASGRAAIRAVQHATTTIPIVMLDVGDPVEFEFVKSLAHPGGNITGVTAIALELTGKQLELLKEAVPDATRIAILGPQPILAFHWPEVQRVAQALSVQLYALVVEAPGEFASAFELATKRGVGALLLLPWIVFVANERRLVELAEQSRLPTMFWRREIAEVGGLMAYGASSRDLFRRAATYVDKILKGAKPADLPVEQPTKFELVINLKTAQALGLTIPPIVLFRADEVIQ